MSKIQWKAEASGLGSQEATAAVHTKNFQGMPVSVTESNGKFVLSINGEQALSWSGDNEEDIEGVRLGNAPEALAEFFLAYLIK